MNVDSLRCFQAAATQLNFRKASAQVFLSPAAFGERIRQLEDSLKVRLFERTTRSVHLTIEGERLAQHARQILSDIDRCAEVVSGASRTPYLLRIGTRFELGLSWLTPALKDLKQQAPERTLSLYFGESQDLLSRLGEGTLDAVVSSVRLTQGKLEYVELHEERYVFVGHRSVRFTRPDDARDHTLLDTQPDLPLFRYLLDAGQAREPWNFRDTEILGSISAVRYRVLERAGVAVLPEYFVRKDVKAGRLKVLLPKAPLKTDAFRLVWTRGDPRAAHFRSLAEALRKRELQ